MAKKYTKAELYPAQTAFKNAQSSDMKTKNPKKYKELYDKALKENMFTKSIYDPDISDEELVKMRKQRLGW